MLSDISIEERCKSENPMIEDFDVSNLQPASYDVHLSDKLKYYEASNYTNYRGLLDPTVHKVINCFVEEVDLKYTYLLLPGKFIIGCTNEKVNIPKDIVCRFEGKSSLGRSGLITHVTAGFIDPGFSGQITLEMKNIGDIPIILRNGMPIGQLSFDLLDRPCRDPYGSNGSHYQNQKGPQLMGKTEWRV